LALFTILYGDAWSTKHKTQKMYVYVSWKCQAVVVQPHCATTQKTCFLNSNKVETSTHFSYH